MKTKIIAVFTVILMVMGLTIAQAGAIAVEKGNGETTTVNDPGITKGGGPNAEGANPAHGPACAFDFCARHTDHPGDGVYPGGLGDEFGVGNLGAWNSVFQSNENSAICGIWATGTEAIAADGPLAVVYACDPDA